MSIFTINYPNTTMNYSNFLGHTLSVSPNNIQLQNANETTIINTGGLSANHGFDMSLNHLTFKGQSGTSGYIIMADSSGSPYWTSLLEHERQDLYDVLSVSNDASGVGITGLNNISFSQGVTLGSVSNTLKIQTPTTIPVNVPIVGLTGYFPVNINGNTYYLQLYV